MKPDYASALYYPYIDIDDPVWLRTAVLFWNRIQTIVPSEIDDPYQNEDSHRLHMEGFLAPLACDLRGELLEDLARRVMKYVESPDVGHAALHGVFGASVDRHEIPCRPPRTIVDQTVQSRLHPSKVSAMLRDRLAAAEYDENGFLLVDERFGAFYMSALANRLAMDTGSVAVSNEGNAFGFQLNSLLDGVVSNSPTAADGLLLSVVTESLILDASVPISRIIRFRHQNEARLHELARKFEELGNKVESSEDPREMREKAGRYYRRSVQPEIDKLKTALGHAWIGAVSGGFRNTITLSAAAGSAMTALLGWAQSNLILGAGAFVCIADIQVQAHLAGKKIRRDSPYSYLLDVEREFSLPARFLD